MDLSEVLAAYKALPEDEQKAALDMAETVIGDRFFVPNPGPQTEAYFSEADELFYGGRCWRRQKRPALRLGR